MASVSVSHLIMFIASLVIAASVAGTLVTGIDRVSTSVDDRSIEMTNQIDSNIQIISDPGSTAIYNEDTTTVSIYIKNTGTKTLDPSPRQVDLLINGEYIPELEVTPIDDGSWSPSQVVEVTTTHELDAGDHRITATVNGNSAMIRFRV